MPERKSLTNIMLQNGVKLTFEGRHQHVINDALRGKKVFFVIDAPTAGPHAEGVKVESQSTTIPTGLLMLCSEVVGDFPTQEEQEAMAEAQRQEMMAELAAQRAEQAEIADPTGNSAPAPPLELV